MERLGEAGTWAGRPQAERTGSERIKSRRNTLVPQPGVSTALDMTMERTSLPIRHD